LRRGLWISVVALGVFTCVAVFVIVSIWAPWSPVADGQLKSDVEEYQGATYVEPPKPQSGLTPDSPTLMDQGTAPTADDVASAWALMSAAAGEGKWQAWGYVADADTGEVLLDAGADALHTPASTAKLFATKAALDHLPKDRTLRTGTSIAGNTLHLWGEGDLLLTAEKGKPGSTSGRAGLADLAEKTAQSLAAAGTSEVALTYQDTLFEGPKRHPSWAKQEVQDYAGDLGPFAINTGRTEPGAWSFVEDSSFEVAAAFSEALKAQGVAVTSVEAGKAPEGGEDVAEVESATVHDQLTFMLYHSDNTMADQYCKLAALEAGAPTTFEGSTKLAVEAVGAAGIDTSTMSLDDCSGLSTSNQVTPKQLAQVLQADKDIIRMLPRAGLSGTLGDRFSGEIMIGNVQAKSGSLGIVSSLAGVLTSQSGRNLVFAVGTDKVPEQGAYWTRGYIDDFLDTIAGY